MDGGVVYWGLGMYITVGKEQRTDNKEERTIGNVKCQYENAKCK
jgi:hypothetical protein